MPKREKLQTYVAKAWYLDSTIWVNVLSGLIVILQNTQFLELFNHKYDDLFASVVIVVNLLLRSFVVKRPVALRHGTPVKVHRIPMRHKATKDAA